MDIKVLGSLALILALAVVPVYAAEPVADPFTTYVPEVPEWVRANGSVYPTSPDLTLDFSASKELDAFHKSVLTDGTPSLILLEQQDYNPAKEASGEAYNKKFWISYLKLKSSPQPSYSIGSFLYQGGGKGTGSYIAPMRFFPASAYELVQFYYDPIKKDFSRPTQVVTSSYPITFSYVLSSSSTSHKVTPYPYFDTLDGKGVFTVASAVKGTDRHYNWWLGKNGPITPPPKVDIDTDGDGKPDLDLDTDGDGKPDLNVDTDDDGEPDANIDTDGDGEPDLNVDTDGDGKPDLDIDKDGDGKPDTNIDTNGDGKPDINIDHGAGKPQTNVDKDGDGKADTNIDTDGDGKPDINIDHGAGKPQTNVDKDGDGKADTNIDTDGDGKPNLNIDHGAGKPQTNIDTNGDKKPDTNIDTNGDGKPDVNIDTDGDGKGDVNVDTDGDGKADTNLRPDSGGGSGSGGTTGTDPDSWFPPDDDNESNYDQFPIFDPDAYNDYKPPSYDDPYSDYDPLEGYDSTPRYPAFPSMPELDEYQFHNPFERPDWAT